MNLYKIIERENGNCIFILSKTKHFAKQIATTNGINIKKIDKILISKKEYFILSCVPMKWKRGYK